MGRSPVQHGKGDAVRLGKAIAAAIAAHAALPYIHHAMPIKIVLKAADETVNNSNVLQNDNELLFAVGANEIWEFFLYFRMTTPTDGATPAIKFAFSVPAAATIARLSNYGSPDMTDTPDGTVTQANQYAVANKYAYFTRYLYFGGVNAGNIQFQWAQRFAAAEDTKVLAGSYMKAIKLN